MHIRIFGFRPSSMLLVAVASLSFAACSGASPAAPAGSSSSGPTDAGQVSNTTGSAPAGNGASPPAGATADRDACTLVTREDAAAALGQPVNEAEVTYANAAKSDCNYTSVGNYGATVLYVQADYGPRARATYDLAKQVYSEPLAVAGTGDAAFAIVLGAPSAQVHFVKGDAYVTVVITNIADEGRLEKAKEAAKRAATRL
ncbi:MAG: hypothetical protein ABIQ34_11755 [Tepidiformaceae bacterium]